MSDTEPQYVKIDRLPPPLMPTFSRSDSAHTRLRQAIDEAESALDRIKAGSDFHQAEMMVMLVSLLEAARIQEAGWPR